MQRGLFGKKYKEWMIGYLDRDTAVLTHAELLDKGLPIDAELYSIYESEKGFLDFTILVLAPPGNSVSRRHKKENSRESTRKKVVHSWCNAGWASRWWNSGSLLDTATGHGDTEARPDCIFLTTRRRHHPAFQ